MPTPYQRALRPQQYIVPAQSSSSVEAPAAIRPTAAIIVQPTASISYSAPTGVAQEASSSSEIVPARVSPSVSPLAKLSPLERLRELARTEPVNFASTLVGIPGSAYLLIRSLVAIFPEIAVFFSWNAEAQTPTPPPTGIAAIFAASSHDSFDWFVALLMAITLVAGLCATLFATNAKKIDFGKDMTKLIVGFIVGFLSGGKVR